MAFKRSGVRFSYAPQKSTQSLACFFVYTSLPNIFDAHTPGHRNIAEYEKTGWVLQPVQLNIATDDYFSA